MAKDKIHEHIIIDLEDYQRSLVPISESLFVDFPPRDFDGIVGRFLKKLSMKRSLKNVKIGVRDIQISPDLILKENINPSHLLSLIVDGKQHNISNSPIPLTLEKELTPFQLFFHPSLSSDCKVWQGQRSEEQELYSVSGTAYVQNENGEDLDTQKFQIDIEFKNLKADVNVELATTRRLQYKYLPDNRIINIGKLLVFNAKRFKRSPKINFSATIRLLDSNGKEVTPYKTKEGIISNRARFIESGETSCSIDNLRSPKIILDGKEDFSPSSKEIEIDLSGIPNPINPHDTFTLQIEGHWAYSSDPHVPNLIKLSKEIRLMKDNQGTELRISSDSTPISSGSLRSLPKFEFSPGGVFREEETLYLENIATDSSRGGRLRLFPPRISTKLGEEGLRLYGSNGKAVDLSKVVVLEGDFVEEALEAGFVEISNGEGRPQKLKVMYNPAEVFSINNGGQYDFSLFSSIEIDYIENPDNRDWIELPRKTFTILLSRPMHILPFPEWLCVDYGSSAIVSMYKGKVLDLNSRRKEIFNKIGREHKEWLLTNDTEPETNTPFISSEILFNIITGNDTENPISSLCGEQAQDKLDYYNTSVCLAPSSNLLAANYLRMLPCLKLLVGNRYLPENNSYNTFKYYRENPDGIVSAVTVGEAKENEESSSLASINNLFDETYKVVFRHYLSQLLPHIERVNRLVLTYPNSYTPDHLKILKGIASDTFRYLRKGQLKFVSESDAVAAYYMDHWKEYNPTENIEDKENILVFDMGAGTLDITYLSKVFNPKDRSFIMEILGKIGVSKAGNYLDFVLASIVAEMGGRSMREFAKVDLPTGANADRTARGRIELKNFVKNQLKPLLTEANRYRSLTFSYLSNDIEVSIGKVLDHKDFKQYLSDVTYKVLDGLKNYVGKQLTVDTIILSGRSVRLSPLQEVLSECISKLPSIRKDGPKLIDLALPGESDRQKTAVVEGAVKFAGSYSSDNSKVNIKSRRLYVSFGVAFRRLGGEWDYVQLANHSEMPDTKEKGSKGFETVEVPGLSHTEEVRLVQTYLSEPQTLNALRKGDFEYISVMNTFDISSFGGQDTLSMAVSIDRHNQVALYVNGQPTVGITPKGVDIDNIITRRSIWPVSI